MRQRHGVNRTAMNDVRTTTGPARARGVLVTAAGPLLRPVLQDLALPTFRSYAARWGYAVTASQFDLDGIGTDAAAQRAKWQKVGLLRCALERFPLALWVDADVLILRDDDDIARHLHPDSFQALAIEQVPYEHRINPNTGVWLLRSCPQAFRFLDAVEAAGQQPGPWADQGAVLAALGWERGDERYRWARPGKGGPFLAGTSWLPPGWNQPYLGSRQDAELFGSTAESYEDRPAVSAPHALHFMGMKPVPRYREMAATLARLSTATTAASPVAEYAAPRPGESS
jgi:hypothetical protein